MKNKVETFLTREKYGLKSKERAKRAQRISERLSTDEADSVQKEESSQVQEQSTALKKTLSFMDAFNQTMAVVVEDGKSVILAKCRIKKPKEEKSEKDKREERTRLITKRKEKQRAYALGSMEEREQERRLKVIATKGVVTLFNSVNAFQNQKRKEQRVEGLLERRELQKKQEAYEKSRHQSVIDKILRVEERKSEEENQSESEEVV